MNENGYKLSMAEFKGQVIASLAQLTQDIAELKKGWALAEGNISDLFKRVALIEGIKDGSTMTWDKIITLAALGVAITSVVVAYIK